MVTQTVSLVTATLKAQKMASAQLPLESVLAKSTMMGANVTCVHLDTITFLNAQVK